MAEVDKKQLIRQVSTKAVLYDCKFPGYRRPLLRDKAWKEIGAAIDVPVSGCKLRWRSLRDSFTKSYKRMGHQATYYSGDSGFYYRISPYQVPQQIITKNLLTGPSQTRSSFMKRLQPQQHALARLKIQTALYEAEFDN